LGSTTGWETEGAWVDGQWYYNVTWVPSPHFWINGTSMIRGIDMWPYDLVAGEGYWMEGVQILDKRVGAMVGGNLTNTYMNMNGTWVEVTGRINVTRHEDPDPSKAVTSSGTYFNEMITFGLDRTDSGYNPDMNPGLSIDTYSPTDFNNSWAPQQSRLIALSSNRGVLTKLLDPSRLDLLKTEPITLRGSVHSRLNGTTGLWDSSAVDDEIKQVQMEITEDGYLYNTILVDDQMFVMDSFGVEVFIEPRS